MAFGCPRDVDGDGSSNGEIDRKFEGLMAEGGNIVKWDGNFRSKRATRVNKNKVIQLLYLPNQIGIYNSWVTIVECNGCTWI